MSAFITIKPETKEKKEKLDKYCGVAKICYKTVVKCGVSCVVRDISKKVFPDDPKLIGKFARELGVSAIIGVLKEPVDKYADKTFNEFIEIKFDEDSKKEEIKEETNAGEGEEC